jgi:peptide/nickel transport system permease protein
MFRDIITRSMWVSTVLIGVTTIIFIVLRLAPGDPALVMLGPGASAGELAQFHREMGFDKPIAIQYLTFLKKAVSLDLGESLSYRQSVVKLVLEAMPATIELSIIALVMAILISIPAGVLSAVKRYSIYDKIVMGGVLLAQSVPPFWLGIMLIFLFSMKISIFPTSGRGSILHLVLPGFTLAIFMVALITRMVRSGMLEVLNEEYVKTARAKGLPEKNVIWKHAFRNTLIPVVTVVGLQFGTILGGAVVIETVFAWPGVGFLAISAIMARDYPLVQACVLMSAIFFVVINFGLDMLYKFIDPRIRYTKG